MTTTTELAVIEDEALEGELEPEYLTEKQAKSLDKKIRTASDRVSRDFNALVDLLEQAAKGYIHQALEYSSWSAYIKDAVQLNITDKIERKEAARLMSGKGMSQRAIAGVLGVSQKTVDRDLEGEDTEGEVEGLDGKTYSKVRVADDPEVIDAEVVEEQEEIEPSPNPTAAADLVREFADEAANLYQALAALADLTTEPKWANARRRVAKANLNNLQEWKSSLEAIIDDLME